MPRWLPLFFLLLLTGWCGAEGSSLLLVVENRNAEVVSRINQELSAFIGQTGMPMCRPVLYDFQSYDHRVYCEEKLGLRRSQLPLLALVELDERRGVSKVISSYENVDRRPDKIQRAVEEWSGETLETLYIPTAGGGAPEGLAIERIEAQQGGAPFYVLNIRITVLNAGKTAVENASMTLFVRERSTQEWRLLNQWPRLSRIAPGFRLSRDYIGKSAEISSADFRVKVVLTTPAGSLEKEAGPAPKERL